MRRFRWLACGLAWLSGCTHPVESVSEEARPQATRVLFIGNSLTLGNDMPGAVKHFASRSRVRPTMQVDHVAVPGWRLRDHWRSGEALAKIREGGWSHVVLQGYSTETFRGRDEFFTMVRCFDEEIRKAGAQTVLYMTWSLKKTPERQKVISDAYHQIGREMGAVVIPVGSAWQRVLKERPGAPIYTNDGKHPSVEGTYLTACVFHAMLHGRSSLGLPAELPPRDRNSKPMEIDRLLATQMQRVADQVAKGELRGVSDGS